MVVILPILLIALLFAALPTWPYTTSGRSRHRVVSEGVRTARAATLPQFSSGDASHFRELQVELQKAFERAAKSSPQKPKFRDAERLGRAA